ncbi:MAG: PPC domain-containing DNA-binding protein [Candidatus Omnitrophota bacterium]
MRVKEGRMFIGRFAYRADLLGSLTDFCKKEKIRLGVFSVIGAVSGAKLGYYHQQEKRYTECVSLSKTLEIVSCVGNISLKDSEIFIHAHITLADHQGQCYGGHLMPGAEIFAAEYWIRELTGGELHRQHDPETKLSLWR